MSDAAAAGDDDAAGGVRLGVLRSVGASSLAALLVAVLLAGPLVLTLLVAAAAVTAGRWALRRLDVLWQAQQLRVQWRAQRPAFDGAHERPARRRGPDAAAAAAADWAPSAGGSDAWRRAFPDAAVAAEVEALASRVVDEFVTELWYRSITPDAQFPAAVRRLICAVVAAAAVRVRALNLGALLIRDACDVMAEQLELYRRVRDSIGEEALERLEPEARDRAMAAEMAADGELLGAAAGPEAEAAVLRHVAGALCPLLLPPADRGSTLLAALARELLAAYVLRPVLGFAAPFWVNKLLLLALRDDKVTSSSASTAPSVIEQQPASPPRQAPVAAVRDDCRGLWDGSPAASHPLAASEPRPATPDGAAQAEAEAEAERTAALQRLSASVGVLPASDAAADSDDGGADELAPPSGPPGVRPARPAAGALRARVIGSSVLGDSFSTHVSYEILVQDGVSGARWLVRRRFSNFEALHRNTRPLRARGRYKLPPKRILFHGTEGGFMDARKALLDRYLQDMLADPRLSGCTELWDFLSVQSRSYVEAPGGGGVLKSVSQGITAGLDSAASAVRAELADAGRKLDKKLERMKGRFAEAQPTTGQQQPASLVGSVTFGSGTSLAASMGGSEAEADVLSDDDASASGDAAPPRAALEPPAPPTALPPLHRYDAEDPGGLSLPLLDLVDAVFRLHERGWVRRRMLSFARGIAELFIGGAVDDALAARLAQLRRGATVASLFRFVREQLWPGGVWYRTRQAAEAAAAGRAPPATAPLAFGGAPPGREAEAAAEARAVCAALLQRSAGAAERLVGTDAYRRGCLELYGLLQSPLFVRQLGYTLLEAALAAAFPEVCHRLLEARTLGLSH